MDGQPGRWRVSLGERPSAQLKPLQFGLNSLALLAVLVAVASVLAINALPGRFGLVTYVVRSGSMEPALHTGSIIFAREVNPNDLQVGDVVVYNLPDVGESVTHRIISVSRENGAPEFKTQGDANGSPDSWTVHYSGSAGRVVGSLPLVGYAWNAVNSPRGRMAFMIIPAAVLAILWLVQIWKPEAKAHEPGATGRGTWAPNIESKPR